MQINLILLCRVEKNFGCREAFSEYITTVFRSFFTYLANAFLAKAVKTYTLLFSPYNSSLDKILCNKI